VEKGKTRTCTPKRKGWVTQSCIH